MDFDRIVPTLLAEILMDNDDANELVSDEDVIRIALRLDPSSWDNFAVMGK